jgi:hypothetical protein
MAGDYQVSKALFAAVKAAAVPQYRLEQRVGLSPGMVTVLIRGYRPIERDDPRVVALAKEVGLNPQRAFSRRRKIGR